MNDRTLIRTGKPEFDDLYPIVRSFLEKDALDVVIEGMRIRGYRSPDAKSIWIRDYSDMLRGLKYFEEDLKSTIEHFADTQAGNGRIFDYFTTFPEKPPSERENWTKYVRVPVEADVEYRFVKAAFLAWQATGDDGWIGRLMPAMEEALGYVLAHPWRMDRDSGLVKRAYTIDTWDFAYTAGRHEWLQFRVDDDTFWGIMHGDNSGYYEAFMIMSTLHGYFRNEAQARTWRDRASRLARRMNDVCWNGRFYTHFVKRTPVEIPGVDEAAQLSLSNPMDINRGVATHGMAVSIIEEYRRRRERNDAFAEWFSIDPPFPDGVFGDELLKRGAYVNGGIMPLVGGELARAAFEHGFEAYGADILERYHALISQGGGTFLWYFPDGTPPTPETSTSPEALSTDGWGSSAMLYGLVEGLAGVEDRLKRFERARISPRWPAAEVSEAEVHAAYGISGAALSYFYRYRDNHLLLDVEIPRSLVSFHILLPRGRVARDVSVNGAPRDFTTARIRESGYVDFTVDVEGGTAVRVEM